MGIIIIGIIIIGIIIIGIIIIGIIIIGGNIHRYYYYRWHGSLDSTSSSCNTPPLGMRLHAPADVLYEAASLPALCRVLRVCCGQQGQAECSSQAAADRAAPRVLLAYEQREGIDELWQEALRASKLKLTQVYPALHAACTAPSTCLP
jgi:hypothetical protein